MIFLYIALACFGGFSRTATLKAWLVEVEAENDTVSACVVHAYLALLWSNVRPSDFQPENVL